MFPSVQVLCIILFLWLNYVIQGDSWSQCESH